MHSTLFVTIKNLQSLFLVLLLGVISCSKNPNKAVADDFREYNILFSGNGHTAGTAPTDNNTYKNKTMITVPGQGSLLKQGFVFSGWNTSESGSGTAYSENDKLTIVNTDVQLYAQWLNEVAYNAFVPSNVSRIDILNVLPLPENQWYYASVDIVNGSLTLKDGQSGSKFQFQYNAESQLFSGNYGFLKISQQIGFRTATTNGKVRTLAQGTLIDLDTFDSSSLAEISGGLHNWGNFDHVFIPALITIVNAKHFGYLDVSYNDMDGQLTIHATAYNRIPNKAIKTGDRGS